MTNCCEYNNGSSVNSIVTNATDLITFEEPTLAPDNLGGYACLFSSFASQNANVEVVSSTSNKEEFFNGKIHEHTKYKVKMNAVMGLNEEMRATYNGEYFDIISVTETGSTQELLIVKQD